MEPVPLGEIINNTMLGRRELDDKKPNIATVEQSKTLMRNYNQRKFEECIRLCIIIDHTIVTWYC